MKLKIKFKFDIAGSAEPYWWHRDSHGIHNITFINFYRATKPTVNNVVIYGLIVGIFHVRLVIRSKYHDNSQTK